MERDIDALKYWFSIHQRILPWRENVTPYRVWISEVMLQQTQVSVVIDYFARWMREFPTIEALARAPIERVIKTWEGLGYYSRARNLHQAAQLLMEQYEGELPSSREELLKIKGLGPYTAGAIAVFAYGQKEPAVDGNVRRVLARYFGIEESIDEGKVQRQIEALARQMLPAKDPRLVVEGLIELGALICGRRPNCGACPLAKGCKAKKMGATDRLPVRKKRQKTLDLHRLVGVIQCQGHILLQKEKEGKVMADLWQFPYFEMKKGWNMDEAEAKVANLIGQPLQFVKDFPMIQHGFTRYRAFLYPHLWEIDGQLNEVEGMQWVMKENLQSLPFCSGHRKLATELIGA